MWSKSYMFELHLRLYEFEFVTFDFLNMIRTPLTTQQHEFQKIKIEIVYVISNQYRRKTDAFIILPSKHKQLFAY